MVTGLKIIFYTLQKILKKLLTIGTSCSVFPQKYTQGPLILTFAKLKKCQLRVRTTLRAIAQK